MISIIICSCNQNDLTNVKKCIEQTIGVPYEIIAIDNRDNKYNIFSAYNEGIKNAQGDILCFMHEDLFFHTQDWGKLLECHLKNENVGLVGVFGAHFMPDCYPVTYWCNPCSGRLLQGSNNRTDKYSVGVLQKYESPQGDANEVEVVVMDGLWLCGNRSLFDKIKFDAETFNGFHCYDLDICMQSLMIGKKNIVVNDILIEHKSIGQVNDVFFIYLKKWYEKWQEVLPLFRGMQKEDLPWDDVTLAGYYLRLGEDVNAGWKACQDIIDSKRYRLINKICKWFHV